MAAPPLEVHEVVPSTMELAHARAEAGAPAGTAILALRQDSGRGRQGRSWSAEQGGLWLSVIIRPPTRDALDPLSLRIGMALARTLEAEIAGLPPVRVKWPNDLIVDGRKCGGILIEARWQGDECQWLVVGVGINLRNPIPESLAVKAVALGDLVPVPPPEALAPTVAASVRAATRGGALTTDELAEWDRRDALRGTTIEGPVAGVAVGITASGALRVRGKDGVVVEVPSGVVQSAN